MSFLSKKDIPLEEFIPDGYIDIHSHLLPGIDDGVKTMYQSAYILERFERMGVKKVITTPHVIQDVWPNTSHTIQENLQEIKDIIVALNIRKLELQASAEYMLDDLFYSRIKSKDILPLHKNYILVEMSTFGPPMNISEFLFEIKLAGYIPILAHPERYSFYHDDLKKFDELKKSGFLFQINLLSLSGYYGERVQNMAKRLMSLDYIDFTGTDIHNYHQLGVLEQGFQPKIAEKVSELMQNNAIFS
ncbi:tyrosine-protein phosphatase [Aquimarina pacifica]|uniref:tyrosine-protein phosphatase n=1 Tax=Aquimarina pacifica TaxID=1296415 RepID=UPI00046F874F|nr:CpsB/CapC family capsule biosynthesis tyrosine phosphatase [Aquimarina pacifica]